MTLKDLKNRIDWIVFGKRLDQIRWVLENEIIGSCDTLLDLGCGAHSPVGHLTDRLERVVGVDLFDPSLETSKGRQLHHEYYQLDVLKAADHFGPDSFDGVVALDLIEHLQRPDGFRLLEQMETMARRKVIIFTPNGFLPQEPFDGNEWQRHVSGWEIGEMREMGFRVIGIAGWKALRGERARIVWRPKSFWKRISFISQLFTTKNPSNAFQILCVKDLS